MSREQIAVDIDEVLFPMAPTFLEFHNLEHGTDINLDQLSSYYIEDITGDSEAEMLAKIDAYLETEHYSAGRPIPNSIESIQRLRDKYDLILITSRHDSYRGSTEDFIKSHFEGLFDSLTYTHLDEDPQVLVPKHVLCKNLGASALIDDSLSNVTEAAQNGIEAVLFGSYPWNQSDELPGGVTRCVDWPAVLEHFDARV